MITPLSERRKPTAGLYLIELLVVIAIIRGLDLRSCLLNIRASDARPPDGHQCVNIISADSPWATHNYDSAQGCGGGALGETGGGPHRVWGGGH